MLGTFGTKKNKSVEVSKPTFQERKNYDYSWNEELITLEEYKNRCNRSTCLHHCNFQ